MIFSSIHAKGDVSKYPQGIRMALNYLTRRDFTKMEPGTYPIMGTDIYAILMDIVTVPAKEKRPESHEDYLDVQFVVSGKERLGYVPYCGNETAIDGSTESDIYFYEDIPNENYVDAVSGCYAIFFPDDIHRPGCMAGKPENVRKVVVKVRMSLVTGCEDICQNSYQ